MKKAKNRFGIAKMPINWGVLLAIAVTFFLSAFSAAAYAGDTSGTAKNTAKSPAPYDNDNTVVLNSGRILLFPSATGTYLFVPDRIKSSPRDVTFPAKSSVKYYIWDKSPAQTVNIPFNSLPDKIKCLASVPDSEMIIWVGDEGDPRFTIPASADVDPKSVIGMKDCVPKPDFKTKIKTDDKKK